MRHYKYSFCIGCISLDYPAYFYHDVCMIQSSKSLFFYWLYGVLFLILMMVVIGGLTRLTGSGLSITVWKPFIGAIPPLSLEAWQNAFEAYKQIPQYHLQNYGMTLTEFKILYWWEWGHRQLGRFLGIFFLIPFLIFWVKQKIPKGYKGILLGFFIGGAFQAFLGWYMVSSGLTERTEVSQYRLALHLGFALLLYCYGLRVLICLKKQERFHFSIPLPMKIWIGCIFLQILSGAFMAGSHAGYTYNTWPLLDGYFIPSGLFPMGSISLFEDILTIQFIHRMGAYGLFCYGVYCLLAFRSFLPQKIFIYGILSLLFPVTIGVLTLVTIAPLEHISLASLHQLSAVWLLTASLIISSYIPSHETQNTSLYS